LGRGKTYEANLAILLVKLPQSEISFDETEGFFHARSTSITSVKNFSIKRLYLVILSNVEESRHKVPHAGFPDWGSWQHAVLTDEVNLISQTLPPCHSELAEESRRVAPHVGFPDWGSWQHAVLTDEVNLIFQTLPPCHPERSRRI
jgi:hypothetical protein